MDRHRQEGSFAPTHNRLGASAEKVSTPSGPGDQDLRSLYNSVLCTFTGKVRQPQGLTAAVHV